MLKSSRRLFLRVANKILPDRLFLTAEHAVYHFGFPSIGRPKTFSDFIHHRQLLDRDPRLPVFADKVRAKQEIAQLLGDEWIIPSLWVGKSARDVPFESLPNGYVLKANHGANMNYFVRPGTPVDQGAARSMAAHWLGNNFGRLHREWAYTQIPRRLLVEPLIGNGEPLVDYKFYVLGGRVRFIDVKLGRADCQVETSAIMDVDWRRLPFRYGPQMTHPTDPAAPASLPRLIEAAETIGKMFSFVRVDFYDVDGRPYFGEATFYPSAGLARFSPRCFDAHFGAFVPDPAAADWSRDAAHEEVAT